MRPFAVAVLFSLTSACSGSGGGDDFADADADTDGDTDADTDTDSDTGSATSEWDGVCCGPDCTPICDLPGQECCLDGGLSCVDAGTCGGTGISACDGPEDCAGTCCWTYPSGPSDPVQSRCVDSCQHECGLSMQRCHASADCPGAQPLCCFAPLPPTGAVGQCVDAACRAYVEDFFGGPMDCDE